MPGKCYVRWYYTIQLNQCLYPSKQCTTSNQLLRPKAEIIGGGSISQDKANAFNEFFIFVGLKLAEIICTQIHLYLGS